MVEDVAVILTRVLSDVQHGLTTGSPPPGKPAAVVNAALSRAG